MRTAASATPVLADVARSPSVEHAVRAVRELLGMEIAYTSRFEDGEQHFEVVDGDTGGFGVGPGTRMPLAMTYCQQMLEGRIPNLLPDLRADDFAAAMPVTEGADVGAFASVPLVRSDGSFYGTLCCAAHTARPALTERDLDFLHVLARVVVGQIEREELLTRVAVLQAEAAAVTALVQAVDARDRYTAEHSREVVALATQVAGALGLTAGHAEEVRQVALLHDIGKVAVPDAVLHKPGALDPREWAVMRLHPEQGSSIVRGVDALAHLAAAIRAEHERWDGGGYPDALAGEAIPLASRIAFVCDAYHAMRSDRPYRGAQSEAYARAELRRHAGTQFCPRSVAALLSVLEARDAVGPTPRAA